VWISLKDPTDLTVKFDLKAEISKENILVSSGQLTSVSPGSGILGFTSATLETIPFSSNTPVTIPQGTVLKLTLSVRNACSGSLRNQGIARLWYNDSKADSKLGVILGNSVQNYFLHNNFLLGTTTGVVPKKTIDIQSGARCSSFKPFGTWSITL